MPLNSQLIHRRLFDELPNFFPSRCDIYARVVVTNEIGERIETPADPMLPGTWNKLFESIPCNFADLKFKTFSEQREADTTYTQLRQTLMLAGFFPTINTTHRAVIDGVAYNIRDFTQSSVGSHTQLDVELIT